MAMIINNSNQKKKETLERYKKIDSNIKMTKIYYPYPSDKPDKKYFIITSSGTKFLFCGKGYEDFTIHKDDKRKKLYITRHSKE